MKVLRQYFLKKDFALFLVVGGVNTLSGTVFSMAYSLVFQANLAFILGYLSALILAYFLNSWIVFHSKLELKRFVKFCVSYIPNFIIQNGVVLIFFNVLHLNRLIVYALAALIGIPVTFILLKLFTFEKRG